MKFLMSRPLTLGLLAIAVVAIVCLSIQSVKNSNGVTSSLQATIITSSRQTAATPSPPTPAPTFFPSRTMPAVMPTMPAVMPTMPAGMPSVVPTHVTTLTFANTVLSRIRGIPSHSLPSVSRNLNLFTASGRNRTMTFLNLYEVAIRDALDVNVEVGGQSFHLLKTYEGINTLQSLLGKFIMAQYFNGLNAAIDEMESLLLADYVGEAIESFAKNRNPVHEESLSKVKSMFLHSDAVLTLPASNIVQDNVYSSLLQLQAAGARVNMTFNVHSPPMFATVYAIKCLYRLYVKPLSIEAGSLRLCDPSLEIAYQVKAFATRSSFMSSVLLSNMNSGDSTFLAPLTRYTQPFLQQMSRSFVDSNSTFSTAWLVNALLSGEGSSRVAQSVYSRQLKLLSPIHLMEMIATGETITPSPSPSSAPVTATSPAASLLVTTTANTERRLLVADDKSKVADARSSKEKKYYDMLSRQQADIQGKLDTVNTMATELANPKIREKTNQDLKASIEKQEKIFATVKEESKVATDYLTNLETSAKLKNDLESLNPYSDNFEATRTSLETKLHDLSASAAGELDTMKKKVSDLESKSKDQLSDTDKKVLDIYSRAINSKSASDDNVEISKSVKEERTTLSRLRVESKAFDADSATLETKTKDQLTKEKEALEKKLLSINTKLTTPMPVKSEKKKTAEERAKDVLSMGGEVMGRVAKFQSGENLKDLITFGVTKLATTLLESYFASKDKKADEAAHEALLSDIISQGSLLDADKQSDTTDHIMRDFLLANDPQTATEFRGNAEDMSSSQLETLRRRQSYTNEQLEVEGVKAGLGDDERAAIKASAAKDQLTSDMTNMAARKPLDIPPPASTIDMAQVKKASDMSVDEVKSFGKATTLKVYEGGTLTMTDRAMMSVIQLNKDKAEALRNAVISADEDQAQDVRQEGNDALIQDIDQHNRQKKQEEAKMEDKKQVKEEEEKEDEEKPDDNNKIPEEENREESI